MEETELLTACVTSYDSRKRQRTQAHIHIGQPGINGGVSVYLCLNPNPPTLNPPAAPADLPPTCPLREGEVEGVLAANDARHPFGKPAY